MFLSCGMWGVVSDKFGRRWAMIIPALIGDSGDAALSAQHRHVLDRRSVLSCRACSAAAECRARCRPISPSASRPRCAPPRALSAFTRARSGAGWSGRCCGLGRDPAVRLHDADADHDDRRTARLRPGLVLGPAQSRLQQQSCMYHYAAKDNGMIYLAWDLDLQRRQIA